MGTRTIYAALGKDGEGLGIAWVSVGVFLGRKTLTINM